MIKLVAFDLDGTLADTLEDLADAANHALRDFGYPAHGLNEYRYFVGSGVDTLFARALPQDDNEKETVVKVRSVFEGYYNQNYCEKTKPYELVPELLEQLSQQHYKLAVLSNKPDGFTRSILQRLFPETEFGYIQGASGHLPKKPDPVTLLACLEHFHIAPEECVYCGDSDVDVQFAHAAAVQVAGAAWGFRGIDELETAGADYTINYPTDLLVLLDVLK